MPQRPTRPDVDQTPVPAVANPYAQRPAPQQQGDDVPEFEHANGSQPQGESLPSFTARAGSDETTAAPASHPAGPTPAAEQPAPAVEDGPSLEDELLDSSDVMLPQPEADALEEGDGEPVKDGKKRKMKKVKTRTGAEFSVPRPGSRLHDPRRDNVALRGSLIAVGAILGLGALALGGFGAVAATSGLSDKPISVKDADNFHLDTYNVAAAAAFGETYLRDCLTRTGNEGAEKARQDKVKQLSTTTDALCSAGAPENSNEELPRREVTAIAYAGGAEPTPVDPNVRYLTFNATTSDGFDSQIVLPIFLADPHAGTGSRIVGPAGLMGPAPLGQPRDRSAEREKTDSKLATQFRSGEVAEFLDAWVGSQPSLTQYTANDATSRAKTGLNGALTEPTITDLAVTPTRGTGSSSNGTINYEDGSQVVATTSITAKTSAGQATAATYRVTLTRHDTKWFISDIQGASVPISQSGTEPTSPSTPSSTRTPS